MRSLSKFCVFLCALTSIVPTPGRSSEWDSLAPLACPGSVRKPVKVEIITEFAHLKPFYELHLTSLLRIFDGWKTPESMTIQFRKVRSAAYALEDSNIAFFPALYPKYVSEKTTDPKSTLAGAAHEIGHIILTHASVDQIPDWKHLIERRRTLPSELKQAEDVFYPLNRDQLWFTTDLDPARLNPQQLEIYPTSRRHSFVSMTFNEKQNVWPLTMCTDTPHTRRFSVIWSPFSTLKIFARFRV